MEMLDEFIKKKKTKSLINPSKFEDKSFEVSQVCKGWGLINQFFRLLSLSQVWPIQTYLESNISKKR